MNSASPAIYLASRSPRRRELLAQIGVAHVVLRLRDGPARGCDVDETPHPGEAPAAYVERLAREKAAAGWRMLGARGAPHRPVLAADTTVALGNDIFGKPADAADAARMLRRLSGTRHSVFTGIAVQEDVRIASALSASVVTFRALSDAQLARYCASGEPLDKAGAYAVQGRAAAFIERIEGSYSGIMGLPLFETAGLLARFGIEVT
jgi:septum formation protein